MKLLALIKQNTTLAMFMVAFVTNISTLGIYHWWMSQDKKQVVFQEVNPTKKGFSLTKDLKNAQFNLPEDFVESAAQTTPTVVHIVASRGQNSGAGYRNQNDLFEEFFRRGGQNPAQSAGSGVIVSTDGYIVTNYHVVAEATTLEVILSDKRTYQASVVGTAPHTDLAVIKIEADNLPAVILGNSDEVQVGEWVLAVGNPFNLESTVTAGIVSAKGRNINILKDKAPIESFIQTDAAVNPGNSGGALVNLKGELIGINTAIATQTGTFAGYSFAVPVNIVKKIMKDLIEFGAVQRAYLGVFIRDLNGKIAQERKISLTEGVLVDSLVANGSAMTGGIKKGDIIIAVEGKKVRSVAELQEAIALRSPGDEVKLEVWRNNSPTTLNIALKSQNGYAANTDIQIEGNMSFNDLGIEVEDANTTDQQRLRIEGGAKITNIGTGKIAQNTNIEQGFIITECNGQPVRSAKELKNILINNTKKTITLGGMYPNTAGKFYYTFSNN
ncbi:MAG: Do family serine endopeptidase [Cytophagales bacterium]|nr:MAG: Do family serine endopeptidase [Cytophagales bacterium]